MEEKESKRERIRNAIDAIDFNPESKVIISDRHLCYRWISE